MGDIPTAGEASAYINAILEKDIAGYLKVVQLSYRRINFGIDDVDDVKNVISKSLEFRLSRTLDAEIDYPTEAIQRYKAALEAGIEYIDHLIKFKLKNEDRIRNRYKEHWKEYSITGLGPIVAGAAFDLGFAGNGVGTIIGGIISIVLFAMTNEGHIDNYKDEIKEEMSNMAAPMIDAYVDHIDT